MSAGGAAAAVADGPDAALVRVAPLALAIAGVMSVMGVWQLDVYQSKTAAATAKRAEGAPVPCSRCSRSTKACRRRRSGGA